MDILFASYQCCIRTIKEGLALSQAGHKVIFLQYRVANPDMENLLPICSFYGSLSQYKAKLESFIGVEIIHVHNEPSSLGYLAKQARPDLPMVFDAHDLNAIRYHQADEDEIRSMEAADGVIFPSVGYERICKIDFEPLSDVLASDVLPGTPTEVIYSMNNRFTIQRRYLPRLRGIVYEGALSADNGFMDYRSIISEFTSQDIPFHVYGTHMDHINQYIAAGAVCMPTLPYTTLLKNLSRYDWGFIGNKASHTQGDAGMPNKLFEYIAAGIPVLVYNAEEAGRYVTEHGIGIVLEDLDEIQAVYDRHIALRETVNERREQLVMETQVDKIIKLYERAMERHVCV